MNSSIKSCRADILSWWVEITTAKPFCIYYFGPFIERSEAVLAQYGYIEDLSDEKTGKIEVEIKKCSPKLLTISDTDIN